jgi:hypothetical protein
MNREEAEEYTQGLEQSLSGGWRLFAWAQRNGIPKAMGLSIEEWIKRVGGNVKMQPIERLEAITELKANGHTNREIAKVLGVDHQTVNNDLRGENSPPRTEKAGKNNNELNDSGENSPLDDDDEIPELTPKEAKIEQSNLRSVLLMNSAASVQCAAVYEGPIDTEIIKACRRAARAWDELANNLERKSSHG